MTKKALITGITGQDGSYLAEFLLMKGYEVHGTIRWKSAIDSRHIDPIFNQLCDNLHYCDLTDACSVLTVVMTVQPDEIYNLGAMSHVGTSFKNPLYAQQVNALGFQHVINAVIACGLQTRCRIYQASTSEMYGNVGIVPQNENTPFAPTSPYACAKLNAHHLADTYRHAENMFIVAGILFNHESPRRDRRFVSRKVTYAVAEYIKTPNTYQPLLLGNLNAMRDWGHAKDYIQGIYLMLQQKEPRDYVLATGITRTVRDLVETAFGLRNVTIEWHGKDSEEVGRDAKTKQVLIKVSKKYFRPSEVNVLQGDASLIRKQLGWKPSYSFEGMLEEMIASDERLVQQYKRTSNAPTCDTPESLRNTSST